MSSAQDAAQAEVSTKIEEIRRRLTGVPSEDELRSMQLHLDALEKWARVANVALTDHQHNHMDDHDNTKLF